MEAAVFLSVVFCTGPLCRDKNVCCLLMLFFFFNYFVFESKDLGHRRNSAQALKAVMLTCSAR